MITAIGLTDFKTHESTELAFGPGTNVIVGVMGSGKSSVMEALCLGLFGTFPSLKSHKLSLSDVVRGFDSENKPASATVRVDFEAEGEKYSVTRQIADGGSEAFLRKAGVLLEGPQPQRVTERVCELLDMDYETFVRTAYCEQNRIDHFLNVGKGDRKRQLDDLLGLERLEVARQSLSTATNKLVAEANAILSTTPNQEQVAEAERLLAEAEASASFFEARVMELGDAEETARKALELKNREVEAARFARDKIRMAEAGVQKNDATIHALSAELTQRQNRIAQLSEAVAGKDAKEIERELMQSNDRLRALETGLMQAASRQSAAMLAAVRLAKVSAETESTNAIISRIFSQTKTANHAGLSEKLASATQAKAGYQQRAAQNRAMLDAAKKALDALASANAECPVCEKPLEKEERERLLAAKQEEVRHYDAEAASAASLFSSEDALERELRSALEKVAVASQKLPALLSEHAQLSSESEKAGEADREVAAAKEALAIERQKNSAIAKATQVLSGLAFEEKALAAALGKITVLQEERNAQLKLLESLRLDGTYADEETHARLEASREVAMRHVFEITSEKERAFSQAQIRRNEAATIRKNISESKARMEAAAKVSQRASKAKAMQNALVEVQENLRTRLISAVNYELSSAWTRLYPYEDYSSARLSPLSDDYALELCTANSEWIGAERASGGERSIASLALRMAFARVLAPRLDVLILDEPTHNLDSAGISALSAALREAVGPGGFLQVFVITHEDGLREAAEATALYEFSRSKQDSNDPTTVSRNGAETLS